MRTRENYFVKPVKRRKPAECKCCNKHIEKGDFANIIEVESNYYYNCVVVIHCVGITCIDCTEEFIANNIKSNSTASKKVIRIDDINEEVD